MQKTRNLSYTFKLNGKEMAEKLGIDTDLEKVNSVDIKNVEGVIVVNIACTVEE
jgi:hypothetical protein